MQSLLSNGFAHFQIFSEVAVVMIELFVSVVSVAREAFTRSSIARIMPSWFNGDLRVTFLHKKSSICARVNFPRKTMIKSAFFS